MTLVELVVVPLVAVTVAVSVSATLEVQVSVDVAVGGMLTLVGFSVHTALPVAVTVRPTVPVKVPRAATVTVEDPPGDPTFAVTLVGLALRLMPGGGPAPLMVTDIGAVELVIRLFVPPVPVIVTENVVVEATVPVSVQVVVAVPPAVRVTDAGLHEAVTPDGEEVEPIATEPANWKVAAPRLVTVTPTSAVPPVLKVTLVVLATMLKPLMRIVSVPSVCCGRPVADIRSLYNSRPYAVDVKLISLVTVWPADNVKGGGTGIGQTIPVVPGLHVVPVPEFIRVIVPVYPPRLAKVSTRLADPFA